MATTLDEGRFRVLNAVVLKKMASVGAVCEATGIEAEAVRAELAALEADGLVACHEDQALPTDEAEPALRAWTDEHCSALRADDEVQAIHQRFEKINSRFLTELSQWQQRRPAGQSAGALTDDDMAQLDGVARLVTRLVELCTELGEHEPRFEAYAERLTRAMSRADAGDLGYLSSPTVDSVHNVWFEFHEDLLRTLGRERQ